MKNRLFGLIRNKPLIFIFCLLLFVGCANKNKQLKEGELQAESNSKIPVGQKLSSAVSPKLVQTPLQRVAILPTTTTKEILEKIKPWENVDPMELFRIVFFGRFSVLPYRDVHIRHVDKILAENNLTNPELIEQTSPASLGKMLQADALIYIKVTDIENVTGGIYSYSEYKVELRMIDVRDGKELWRAELEQTLRGGLIGKSSQISDLIAFEKQNRNRPLVFRKVAEDWSYKVIEDLKEKVDLNE